jgi:hypothetical protein
MHLVFSMFTSSPTSKLASIRVSVFSLWCLCYLPLDSHHQHRRAADVSHLIPVPPENKNGDTISLFLFFQYKESRLKMDGSLYELQGHGLCVRRAIQSLNERLIGTSEVEYSSNARTAVCYIRTSLLTIQTNLTIPGRGSFRDHTHGPCCLLRSPPPKPASLSVGLQDCFHVWLYTWRS